MKRHVTASAAIVDRSNKDESKDGAAKRTHVPYTRNKITQPTLKLASARDWTHTLVLTGELNQRSAHALEADIERLCEDGVTGITLDLRQLTAIDPTGVAVIAFRSALCKRRGYQFTLIPGRRRVQRTFEQAGIAGLLPFQEHDAAAQRPADSVLGLNAPAAEDATPELQRDAVLATSGADSVSASGRER
jgi:anti-anti-sigma factor